MYAVAFKELPEAELGWLGDEFFLKVPTVRDILSLAEHYEDIVAHNAVADGTFRAELARRAAVLRQIGGDVSTDR